jgi:hypothetical protein
VLGKYLAVTKLSTYLSCDPAVSLLGTYSRDTEAYIHKKMYQNIGDPPKMFML